MACQMSALLGAYLLGVLDPVERSAMSRHISACQDCRAELLAMAPLPGLLRHTRFEEPSPTTSPASPAPESVLPASTGPAARDRAAAEAGGRRGVRKVLIASVLAVAAAGTAIGVYVGTATPSVVPRPTSVTLSATNPSTRVSVSATLTPEATGTMVRLTLTGLPPGTTCHLVVHARDGDSETAASWASGYSTADTVPASTAVNQPDIASLDIVTNAGRLLVAISQP